MFTYSPISSVTGTTTTYTWSRATVSGISTNTNTGTGSVNEFLVNTDIVQISVPYLYTLTANACSNTQVVTVIVKPTPNIVDQPITICNNSTISITPTNVPIGTTYTWTVTSINPAVVNGTSPQATGQSSFSQSTLNNTSTNNATVTYKVTPTAASCPGATFNATATVNPSLVLSSNSTAPAICSNTSFLYNPTSATATSSIAWTRAVISGISNPSATGTGNPNEILINTTAQAVTVPYTFTLTSLNGCVSSQTVTVQVNPSPTLSNLSNTIVACSGSAVSYVAQSSTTATYSWSRAAVAGISTIAGSGSNNIINETLINSGT